MESLVEKRLFVDKCCLITGASGFKRRWLSLLLEAFGARVVGLAIRAHDRAVVEAPQSMDFRGIDIRDKKALRDVITQTKPDIFRALEKKETLIIRHPSATRFWKHVLDPLLAYLQIATDLIEQKKAGYHSYNIGPNANGHKTVGTLLDEFKKHVAFDYQVDANTKSGYESGLLSLETSKVAHEIGWKPAIEFSDAVKLTAECYMQASDAKHTMEVMRQQISYYAR